MGEDAAPKQRLYYLAKDRIPQHNDQRDADRERHPGSELFEKPQPLAQHHDRQHGAEQKGQQAGRATRRGSSRCRRFGARYAVTGGLDGPAEGVRLRRAGRIHFQHGLLRRQQHFDATDARYLLERPGHVARAFGAIHAFDGQFDRLHGAL